MPKKKLTDEEQIQTFLDNNGMIRSDYSPDEFNRGLQRALNRLMNPTPEDIEAEKKLTE